MAKKPYPSLTAVRKLLKDATFDPRKNPKMGVVADVNNPDFYEEQAILLIKEAQEIRRAGGTNKHYSKCLVQAIQILTLSRFYGAKED